MSGSAAPRILLAASALAAAVPARAHHGGVGLGVAGPEGPGAAIETSSPMPLPRGVLFLMLKSEYVSYRQLDFAEPENKTWSAFDTVAVGYGFTPWLSAYLFLPYNAKSQDVAGTNVGFGDPNLLANLAFKYDEGFRLVPEKESLDELADWHFSAFASVTLPMGPTTSASPSWGFYRPDMQTGFGSPSFQVGVAALKQLSADLTWLADASYQLFLPHTYPFTRYQFGGEARASTALTWRAASSPAFRLDLAGEVNLLNVQRDRERDAQGTMERLRASGGTILYGGLGLRAYLGRLSVALAARTSFARWLNEETEQQGSEGLEWVRAALTLAYAVPP